MRFIKRLVLVLACSVPDIVTSIPALVMWLFFGENLRRVTTEFSWALAFNLKKDSWPERTWYKGWGGTTFGRIIMLGHGDDREDLVQHELVHVEQYEAGCLFGALLLGLAPVLFPLIGMWFPFVLWALSSWLFTLTAMVAAWLRGEEFYRGSHREEAAYALARQYEMGKRGMN